MPPVAVFFLRVTATDIVRHSLAISSIFYVLTITTEEFPKILGTSTLQ